ncbi:MAG: hypothetical protein QMD65_03400 [Patescibacteria group bacterium]|nr:hypothetical protein [Patescibacteria group bacterium]
MNREKTTKEILIPYINKWVYLEYFGLKKREWHVPVMIKKITNSGIQVLIENNLDPVDYFFLSNMRKIKRIRSMQKRGGVGGVIFENQD